MRLTVHTPSSTSGLVRKSIVPVGAKTISPSLKYCPQGRRTSVPDGRTELARE
jgi:hypothetical protein